MHVQPKEIASVAFSPEDYSTVNCQNRKYGSGKIGDMTIIVG